jgi:RNA polymerase sigma factor (sigma-70 family)
MLSSDAPDFSALLDRYERPLVRYAQSIVGDEESARDVVQDVFIRLARGEMRIAPASAVNGTPAPGARAGSAHPQLQSWLFTVTRNRALDHHRKHRRIIPMTLPDDRPCEAPSPSVTLERRDGEASLLRLLDTLPPNQREVIRLKFQNDLSYREIAEVTQLTVTNVGFLLHTGLKKLRTLAAGLPQDDLNLHFRNSSAV